MLRSNSLADYRINFMRRKTNSLDFIRLGALIFA